MYILKFKMYCITAYILVITTKVLCNDQNLQPGTYFIFSAYVSMVTYAICTSAGIAIKNNRNTFLRRTYSGILTNEGIQVFILTWFFLDFCYLSLTVLFSPLAYVSLSSNVPVQTEMQLSHKAEGKIKSYSIQK